MDGAPMPRLRDVMAGPQLAPGVRLGAFEITGTLGAGGMGEVYRARDTRLGREVALKLLPAILAASPDRRARFERESRLLAAPNHPNIGAIHGIEEVDGRLVLVLELVGGPTLADRLASGAGADRGALRLRAISPRLSGRTQQGSSSIATLKPANVAMHAGGRRETARLRPRESHDTASARPTAPSADPDVSGAGMILGTGADMSPEQARGQSIDRRTDNWAFGCVLYEMLVGQARVLGQHDVGHDCSHPGTRAGLDGAAPGALPGRPSARAAVPEKDPHHREIHDIADARVEIEERWLRSAGRGGDASRSWKQRWWVIGLAAVVVLGLFIQGWVRSDRQPTRVTSAPLRTVPLTSLPGRQRAPTFSPDGNQIRVRLGRRNRERRYLRAAGGCRTPLRLTTDPHRTEIQRGRRTVASSLSSGSGHPRAGCSSFPPSVVPSAGSPQFTGRTTGTCTVPVSAGLRTEGSWPSPTQLRRRRPGACSWYPSTAGHDAVSRFRRQGTVRDVAPAISPDGHTVAFVRVTSGGLSDIYLVPFDGGEPKRLTFSEAWIERVAWAANGRDLVYSSGGAFTGSTLWRVSRVRRQARTGADRRR